MSYGAEYKADKLKRRAERTSMATFGNIVGGFIGILIVIGVVFATLVLCGVGAQNVLIIYRDIGIGIGLLAALIGGIVLTTATWGDL